MSLHGGTAGPPRGDRGVLPWNVERWVSRNLCRRRSPAAKCRGDTARPSWRSDVPPPFGASDASEVSAETLRGDSARRTWEYFAPLKPTLACSACGGGGGSGSSGGGSAGG